MFLQYHPQELPLGGKIGLPSRAHFVHYLNYHHQGYTNHIHIHFHTKPSKLFHYFKASKIQNQHTIAKREQKRSTCPLSWRLLHPPSYKSYGRLFEPYLLDSILVTTTFLLVIIEPSPKFSTKIAHKTGFGNTNGCYAILITYFAQTVPFHHIFYLVVCKVTSQFYKFCKFHKLCKFHIFHKSSNEFQENQMVHRQRVFIH